MGVPNLMRTKEQEQKSKFKTEAELEAFNKKKKEIQNFLLEKTAKISEEQAAEIKSTYGVSEEIAKAILVFEAEYALSKGLVADYYLSELERLEQVNYKLPEIFTFQVRFSVEEGFWIKYLVVDFPKRLLSKMSKLLVLDHSIFGSKPGEKDDAALFLIEREYLSKEEVFPIISIWVEEHQRASYYDAAASIICSLRQEQMEEAPAFIEELMERLAKNLQEIKNILANLDRVGWVETAYNELELIMHQIANCQKDPTDMGRRLAAELIIENQLLEGYESGDWEAVIPRKELGGELITPTKTVIQEKKELALDKFSLSLHRILKQSEPRKRKMLGELVEQAFNEEIIKHREKPTIAAKKILTKVMEELNLDAHMKKMTAKDFEHQLMFKMGPNKDNAFQNKPIDERIRMVTKNFIMDLLMKNDFPSERIVKPKTRRDSAVKSTPDASAQTKTITQPLTEKEKTTLKEKIIDCSTEAELIGVIKNNYWEALFQNDDPVIAGGNVLKNMLSAVGVNLTKKEATNYIKQAIAKANISIDSSNQKEIDGAIWKAICKRLKETGI